MTRPLFNPILLESPDGCDQAVRELGIIKQAVHNRLQALDVVQRRRPLTPMEVEEQDALGARLHQLTAARRDCKARKMALVDASHRTYAQAVIDAAREILDPELYRQLHVRAATIVAADAALRDQRRAVGYVGSAIPMRGSAAPTQQRRAS